MATIRPHGKGFRAEVARMGVRRSKVFRTKREAADWASRTEVEILASGGQTGAAAKMPFRDVLQRYAREVSPRKAGERWEIMRLNAWMRLPIADKAMRSITPDDLALWRDTRRDTVSAGTVRREMNLMAAVFSQSVKIWKLIPDSPMKEVRKPPPPPRRTRLVTAEEMERLAIVAGGDLRHATARTWHAFRLACETGMRSGEVLALTWAHVDLKRRVAHLPKSKNGDARDVPLSAVAVDLLKALDEQVGRDAPTVFDLAADQRDVLWRKIRDKAGVVNLTFHDTRHYAITMMSKKLDVLALARTVGHRDIKQLMTYYEASAEDLAKLLD